MKPKRIKALQAQSRHLNCRLINKRQVLVESATDPSESYIVTIRFGKQIDAQCTCEWAQHQGSGCSHVMAALEHLANLKQRTLSFWTDERAARRQKHRCFYLKGGLWITSRNAA